MGEGLKPVLRFAVARPGTLFLAALGGAVIVSWAATPGEHDPAWQEPLLGGCLALAYLAAVQGLRVSWYESRAKAIVLASLFALVGGLLLQSGGGALATAIALSPVALAVALERVLRGLRASHGPLWLDGATEARGVEAPPATAEKPGFWRRNRWGCLGLLALLMLAVVAFLWQLTIPGRHAAAARARLVPGMSVAEIVGTAESPYMCTIVAPGDPSSGEAPPVYRIWADRGGYSLTIADGRSRRLARDALLAELRGAALSSYREVAFTFRTSTLPLNVSFRVTLDAAGRLKEVGPSRTWD